MIASLRRLVGKPTTPLDLSASPLPLPHQRTSTSTTPHPPHVSAGQTPSTNPSFPFSSPSSSAPPGPERYPTLAESEAKVEKYFRRVANENRLPTRANKVLGVAAWTGGAFACAYMVLYADFGKHEHVFSPVRRHFHAYTNSIFTLSENERSYLGLDQPLKSPPTKPAER